MNTRKGFTLVELLVVIAILAILATVSVVGYTSFINRANESTAMQELVQIRDAVNAEDINNKNFDLSDGLTTDAEKTAVTTFVNSLGMTNGTFTVATDGKSATYTLKNNEKVVATWTFSGNTVAAETKAQ